MAKKNIFDNAKKTTPKKENTLEIRIDSLEKDVLRYIEVTQKIEELQKEKDSLDEIIKNSSKKEFIKQYEQTKQYPGSINILSGQTNFLFVTSDKYEKIDEQQAIVLKQTYGDIVTEETKFSFNTTILLKYKVHISKLLLNSKKISKEDKDNLIINETFYVIKSGLIKDLYNIVTKGLSNIETLLNDIKPTFSIKSVKSK